MSNQQHAVGWVERSETHQAHAGIDGFRSSTHPTWLESPQLRRYSSLNTPAKPMPTDGWYAQVARVFCIWPLSICGIGRQPCYTGCNSTPHASQQCAPGGVVFLRKRLELG